MANKCHIHAKRIVAAGLLTVATSSIHAQQQSYFWDPSSWQVTAEEVALNYSFDRVTLVQGVPTRTTVTGQSTELPFRVDAQNFSNTPQANLSAEVTGAFEYKVTWDGDGAAPDSVLMLVRNASRFGGLGNAISGWVDNGFGANAVPESEWPWIQGAGGDYYVELPIENGFGTIRFEMGAQATGTATPVMGNSPIASAWIDVSEVAVADRAIEIEPDFGPSYEDLSGTRALIRNPDPTHKRGVTGIEKSTQTVFVQGQGFVTVTNYFAEVTFTAELLGNWVNPEAIDWTAQNAVSATENPDGSLTARWQFTQEQVDLMSLGTTFRYWVEAQAIDDLGPSRSRTARYDLRFHSNRVFIEAGAKEQHVFDEGVIGPVFTLEANAWNWPSIPGMITHSVTNNLFDTMSTDPNFLPELERVALPAISRVVGATATMTTNPAVAEVPPAPNARVGQFFRSVRRGDFPIEFGRYNRTGFSGYLDAEARVWYNNTTQGVNELDHETRFIVAASFEP